MITYFPEIYPDELLYSLFSRYYAKSGYMAYKNMAEILFVNTRDLLDFQYVNRLKPEIIEYLARTDTWENTVINHTLFPYYARFISPNAKKEAFRRLTLSKGNHRTLLPNPIRKNDVFMKYCPLCAKEQRQKYGEVYWNRIHQIPEISICPIHKCKLMNTELNTNECSKQYFCFYPADLYIKDTNIEYVTNKVEIDIAHYIYEILKNDFDFDKDICAGKFLHSKIDEKYYISNRRDLVDMDSLFHDFKIFYKDIENHIQTKRQLSDVFNGQRLNPYEIAQIGLFLQVPASEIITSILPKARKDQLFDEKVIFMLNQGKSINHVAKELNVSRNTIYISKNNNIQDIHTKECIEFQQKIKTEREFWLMVIEQNPNTNYTTLCKNPGYSFHLKWLRQNDKEWTDAHYPITAKKKEQGAKNLRKLDEQYLPFIETIILNYKESGESGEKPKKITINIISKLLGLKHAELYNMPKCRKVVESFQEPQEEYWAREVVWAVNKLINEKKSLNYTNIKKLINVPKKRIVVCIPYINRYADDNIVKLVKRIILGEIT